MDNTELDFGDFTNFQFFQAASYLQQTEKRILDEKDYVQLNDYLHIWLGFLTPAYHLQQTKELTEFSHLSFDELIAYYLQYHSELMAIELASLTQLNGEQWYQNLSDGDCELYVRSKIHKANKLLHELMETNTSS